MKILNAVIYCLWLEISHLLKRVKRGRADVFRNIDKKKSEKRKRPGCEEEQVISAAIVGVIGLNRWKHSQSLHTKLVQSNITLFFLKFLKISLTMESLFHLTFSET